MPGYGRRWNVGRFAATAALQCLVEHLMREEVKVGYVVHVAYGWGGLREALMPV